MPHTPSAKKEGGRAHRPGRAAQDDVAAEEARAASLADVVERLFAEFEDDLDLPAVVDVVRTCRRDLDTVDGPALCELVERLARVRLESAASGRA